VGKTYDLQFPLVNPIQSSMAFRANYLARWNASGGALDFSSYFSGYSDTIGALAVSPAGSLWFAGTANDAEFPAANGPNPNIVSRTPDSWRDWIWSLGRRYHPASPCYGKCITQPACESATWFRRANW